MATLCKTITIFVKIFLGIICLVKVGAKPSAPQWKQLCDKGHQYLFSEETADWNNAREMCELFGGYLVRIENRHENNCILYHALTNGLHQGYWWTSGNL